MNNLVGVGSVSTVFRKVQTIKALALGPAMSFIFLLGGLGLAFFNVMVLMFKSSFFLFFFSFHVQLTSWVYWGRVFSYEIVLF